MFIEPADPRYLSPRTNLPVVNRGDARFHIAEVMGSKDAEHKLGAIEDEFAVSPLFDEDEIL